MTRMPFFIFLLFLIIRCPLEDVSLIGLLEYVVLYPKE